jgi:hypothetical protein
VKQHVGLDGGTRSRRRVWQRVISTVSNAVISGRHRLAMGYSTNAQRCSAIDLHWECSCCPCRGKVRRKTLWQGVQSAELPQSGCIDSALISSEARDPNRGSRRDGLHSQSTQLSRHLQRKRIVEHAESASTFGGQYRERPHLLTL